jgi:hypothetical protein
MFPLRYELNLYIQCESKLSLSSRLEAGYNTSSATLRVVGGDEKGTQSQMRQ